MFASCSPQPNWMPRKPKLMLNSCGRLRRGRVMWVLGAASPRLSAVLRTAVLGGPSDRCSRRSFGPLFSAVLRTAVLGGPSDRVLGAARAARVSAEGGRGNIRPRAALEQSGPAWYARPASHLPDHGHAIPPITPGAAPRGAPRRPAGNEGRALAGAGGVDA